MTYKELFAQRQPSVKLKGRQVFQGSNVPETDTKGASFENLKSGRSSNPNPVKPKEDYSSLIRVKSSYGGAPATLGSQDSHVIDSTSFSVDCMSAVPDMFGSSDSGSALSGPVCPPVVKACDCCMPRGYVSFCELCNQPGHTARECPRSFRGSDALNPVDQRALHEYDMSSPAPEAEGDAVDPKLVRSTDQYPALSTGRGSGGRGTTPSAAAARPPAPKSGGEGHYT